MNIFKKNTPEYLPEDAAELVKDLVAKKEEAWYYFYERIRKRADQRYHASVPDADDREGLNKSALAYFLEDVSQEKPDDYGDSVEDLVDLFEKRYLKRVYREEEQAQRNDLPDETSSGRSTADPEYLIQLLTQLRSGNDRAWDELQRLASPVIQSLSVFNSFRDKDERKDVFQDTMSKIFLAIRGDQFSESRLEHSIHSLRAYIRKIARNTAIDHLRKQKYYIDINETETSNTDDEGEETVKTDPGLSESPPTNDDDLVGYGENGYTVISYEEFRRKKLKECLEALKKKGLGPEDDPTKESRAYTLVLLKYFEKLKHAEIALLLEFNGPGEKNKKELKKAESASESALNRAIEALRKCMIKKGFKIY